MKKFRIQLTKTFTYQTEIEGEDKLDLINKQGDIIEKICEEDSNLLDHSQESGWEIVDIDEVE